MWDSKKSIDNDFLILYKSSGSLFQLLMQRKCNTVNPVAL